MMKYGYVFHGNMNHSQSVCVRGVDVGKSKKWIANEAKRTLTQNAGERASERRNESTNTTMYQIYNICNITTFQRAALRRYEMGFLP